MNKEVLCFTEYNEQLYSVFFQILFIFLSEYSSNIYYDYVRNKENIKSYLIRFFILCIAKNSLIEKIDDYLKTSENILKKIHQYIQLQISYK